MSEIRFSGFGGQGIVRCSLIAGKAANIFDDKFATMTQSFGPEARGGACASQLVISDQRIAYPYVTKADILITLSQEAYDTYEPQMSGDGVLIADQDLVKTRPARDNITLHVVPATRFAEELGNRIFTNLVTLGFFTGITGVISADAMKKALPGLVPDRFLTHNVKAFERGYEYAKEVLAVNKKTGSKKKGKK